MPSAVGIMADAYKAPAGGWTPASLPGLWSWWDSSDTATITHAAGAVSQVNDKSGNGRHLTQSNATYRPMTGTTTINGLNTIDFSAGAKVLTVAGATTAQPISVAQILRGDAVNTSHRTLGANVYLAAASGGTTGRWQYGSSTAQTSTVDQDTAPHLLVGVFNNAGTSTLRLDRAEIVAGAPGANGFGANLFYGANSAIGATAWRKDLGETVVTTTVLAGADLTSLETYLRTKWNTP